MTAPAPEAGIHQALTGLLLAGRLPPGTQLVETRLAAIFGVSRERVRKVLHRLGHERLVDIVPNRGCFVSSPTLAQAREIYDARRIVEGGIVAWLAGRLDADQLQRLEQHGQREHQALQARDRALSIALSGEFHMLLAQCTGSDYVVRTLQELVSRTSMLVAFFEPAASSECACEEHDEVLAALRQGDAGRAGKAMHVHLSLIETRLRPRPGPAPATDPELEIATAWQAAQAGVERPPRAPARPPGRGRRP